MRLRLAGTLRVTDVIDARWRTMPRGVSRRQRGRKPLDGAAERRGKGGCVQSAEKPCSGAEGEGEVQLGVGEFADVCVQVQVLHR